MVNDLKFKKVKDKSDKLTKIDKGMLPNLPFRMCIVGRSGSGKTSALVSLLCDSRYYKNDFKGENIYIFSPMVNDKKMEMLIDKKSVPCINLFTGFDDEILNSLYDDLVQSFQEEEQLGAKKIAPKLIIMDDISFDGSLKKGNHNAVSRCFMNGRKHGINIIVLTQYYRDILKSCRINASALITFTMNESELDALADEHAMMKKSEFKDMIRNNCVELHDFICINYSNNRKKGIYLNSNFEKIG